MAEPRARSWAPRARIWTRMWRQVCPRVVSVVISRHQTFPTLMLLLRGARKHRERTQGSLPWLPLGRRLGRSQISMLLKAQSCRERRLRKPAGAQRHATQRACGESSASARGSLPLCCSCASANWLQHRCGAGMCAGVHLCAMHLMRV